jgi:hypothetical protein
MTDDINGKLINFCGKKGKTCFCSRCCAGEVWFTFERFGTFENAGGHIP